VPKIPGTTPTLTTPVRPMTAEKRWLLVGLRLISTRLM
jgi:hypothetical protein